MELDLISLEDKHILPCTGCSSCGGATYRQCVLKDEMQQIYPRLARSGPQVIITPITFGGYSSIAKTVQERFSPLGDPRYYIEGGELVKGMGLSKGNYYVIGVKDGCTDREREVFLRFHSENLRIMNRKGAAWILDTESEDAALDQILEVICNG